MLRTGLLKVHMLSRGIVRIGALLAYVWGIPTESIFLEKGTYDAIDITCK